MLVVYFRNCAEMDVFAGVVEAGRRVENNTLHVPMRDKQRHEFLQTDSATTATYKNAMYHNKHLFMDKTVLDVGCGTGILSMFAAKAGARMVIGVESSPIAEQATKNVKENKLDNIIKIVRGEVEEVELPAATVDIIISEWMGYCLFYESSLEAVLYARDKWLAEGGIVFPDRATLYVCGIEDTYFKENKFDSLHKVWYLFAYILSCFNFFHKVHGFNMSRLKTLSLLEPVVDYVSGKRVVTDSCVLKEFDMQNGRKEDLKFTRPFQLQIMRNDYVQVVIIVNHIHHQNHQAFLTYFNVEFSACHKKTWLSTGPGHPPTHWKQVVVLLTVLRHCSKHLLDHLLPARVPDLQEG